MKRVIRYILAEDFLDAKKRHLQWLTRTLTTTIKQCEKWPEIEETKPSLKIDFPTY